MKWFRKIKGLVCIVEEILFARLPVNERRIYFYNIWGKYNDNTKYLAIEFHNKHPDWEIIYEISEDSAIEGMPTWINCVKRCTLKSRYFKSTSKIVIDNDWGAVKKSITGKNYKLMACIHKMKISTNTIYISTGHGVPLKYLGNDCLGVKYDNFITSTKYMFLPDKHSENVMRRITMGKIKNFIITGSPRNDRLFESTSEQDKIKNMLHINKKIALFAPTFRTKVEDGKTIFLGAQEYISIFMENAEVITSTLSEKFGNEWCIGLRLHPGAIKSISINYNELIFDANKLQDITDYLLVTDVLITDYSSCCFDFSITKKPCFLLWYDEDLYKNKERGLYFNREELPFPISNDLNGLIQSIRTFDQKIYEKKIIQFHEKIGMVVEGGASSRIIEFVDDIIQSGENRNDNWQ